MALTATAQSALPLEWDETIVPALRKRLESESLILAKRMSVASITSVDEAYPYPDQTFRKRNVSPTDYGRPFTRAPNGRSTQPDYGNLAQTPVRPVTTGKTAESRDPPKRTRTYSQPYPVNLPQQNGHTTGSNGVASGLPTPDSSRSTSPLYLPGRFTDTRPTRIPVHVRGRTPSMSSNGGASHYNGRTSDVGSGQAYIPPLGADLWTVQEAKPTSKSRSSISLPRREPAGILTEPAPFKVGSMKPSASSQYVAPRQDPPRQSTDSEERPFEHWYRGDVHRNGGVGELRVGAKQEMLDIANYGHRFAGKSKPKTPPAAHRASEEEDHAHRRKRAGSFSERGARESFYMDEERARELANVLHEDPLTDLEGDGDPDASHSFSDHDHPIPPVSPPLFFPEEPRSEEPRSVTSTHPSIERERSAPHTRIPGPAASRQSLEPSLQDTPIQPPDRGGSEPPGVSSSSSSPTPPGRPQNNRSVSNPMDQQSGQGKTPGPPNPSPSKKPKPKTSKSPSRLKMADNKNRGSVAVYPEPPTSENVMDAIPSWTQPTGRDWDEVVLPVVARKKGLDGHYEEGDANPQPKKVDVRIEPAPGTFGYDHTKYRPPRDDIPMDEFGQRPMEPQDVSIAEEPEPQDGPVRQSFAVKQEDDARAAFVQPTGSPAPFAQYAPPPGKESGVPNILITRPTLDENADEHGGGCCKCVIM
ncbi:hypothetical protein FIBSPDRAFT_854977 [Athelia psychrophila]|uniref:Uncharacterized protein n=1 Tax=Athelia psychrophila TaxID=1759441 RepID=A0A166PQG2_9AGAM|nr:hypothetical protein FIBSPDRAFT_854977 [Fibularhizoctonia sp. CBS 109695]